MMNDNKFHYWELSPNKSTVICLVVQALVVLLWSGLAGHSQHIDKKRKIWRGPAWANLLQVRRCCIWWKWKWVHEVIESISNTARFQTCFFTYTFAFCKDFILVCVGATSEICGHARVQLREKTKRIVLTIRRGWHCYQIIREKTYSNSTNLSRTLIGDSSFEGPSLGCSHLNAVRNRAKSYLEARDAGDGYTNWGRLDGSHLQAMWERQ